MARFQFLDDGLDEMAAVARAGFLPRLAATIVVGLIAANFLPWQLCAVWAGWAVGWDGLSFVWSRDQFLGRPVSPLARKKHVLCLVAGVAGWSTLGVLLWTSGTAAGAICAVVIWLALMGFAQVHGYQSRAGYVLSGVIPAAEALITPLVAPSHALDHPWAVWGIVTASVAFSLSSAQLTRDARRRHEQVLADLEEREHSYRLLADNITDVVALGSADHRRLYVSPSIEKILGFAPGELLATPNYTYLHPDDAAMVPPFIEAVSEASGPQTLEYRVTRKDGQVIWAETTFSRLGDGSGRVLSVSRDVTHRKALEAELKDAAARAETAAAAKQDFLANMTHELRTPLTAILGFAEVLQQSDALSPRDARHARLIHDASQTLLGVVGDVLDYSKLEAGALELDPEAFDPEALVRSAAEIVAEQAQAKGLTLGVEIDGEPPALVGDAMRLRQVLLNFLSNAVKFTRDGGISVKLSQRPAGERMGLRIEVSDSGIGIEADQIGQLFARFTQADASVSRRFGGTGLGLAISKQIIAAMGGRIGAESQVGEGSTFWFEVELPQAQEGALATRADTAQAGLARPIRVLAAEDNPVNRELIATLLGAVGVELDMACDGAEAVEAVRRQRYDVILMDMQMPVMDGLAATRAIRALPDREAAATPIIAMTANVLPEQVARCREAGMDDHLGKPINLAHLLAALDRWSAPRDEAANDDEATG